MPEFYKIYLETYLTVAAGAHFVTNQSEVGPMAAAALALHHVKSGQEPMSQSSFADWIGRRTENRPQPRMNI